jgi:MutS domain V
MKAFLLYRDKDFTASEAGVRNASDLVQDLELEKVLETMAGEDKFLLEVARPALLVSLGSVEAVLYRQHILTDCLEYPSVVREVYDIAVEAIEHERKAWGWMSARYPSGTLHRGIEVLEIFSDLLRKLRRIAAEKGASFRSEGFRRLFEMIATELDEAYMGTIDDHLVKLKFRGALVMTAALGMRNKGVDYVLRKPWFDRRRWWEKTRDWLTGGNNSQPYYEIPDRDEAGFRALSELTDEGISDVAAALAQSSDHILSFFRMLRLELAFYIGCINLRDRLLAKGERICLPEPLPLGGATLSAQGLYDPSLSLRTADRVVSNDVQAMDKTLMMVTGANRGGKSTLLRSIGVAQLMMQAGMFVPAESFRADIRMNVFTHFKREEDASMKSGKLDEELRRMTSIIDQVPSNSLILFNESFASTNEREGSEIARQIVRSLLESEVKVVYVTHMYNLSHGFYSANLKSALFLRAERLSDGERTYRLSEGEPLPTSHGEDLYRRIFADPADLALADR